MFNICEAYCCGVAAFADVEQVLCCDDGFLLCQELDPALDGLLRHPDWEWFDGALPRFSWDAQVRPTARRP